MKVLEKEKQSQKSKLVEDTNHRSKQVKSKIVTQKTIPIKKAIEQKATIGKKHSSTNAYADFEESDLSAEMQNLIGSLFKLKNIESETLLN